MINCLFVAVGGFFGAIARFGISKWMNSRFPSMFPIATLFVNLTGAFLLGLMIGKNMTHTFQLLFGTGFMGAFTTFSTFKLETIQLKIKGKWGLIGSYLFISYVGGMLLAFFGLYIGGQI